MHLFFIKLFPKQKNLFASFIKKPNLEEEHYEWLKFEDKKLKFNSTWANKHYKRFL